MPETTPVDAPDTAHSALVTDHVYKPKKGEPWGLCAKCGMGQASHQSSGKSAYKPPELPYRCPNCVTKGVTPCQHQPK